MRSRRVKIKFLDIRDGKQAKTPLGGYWLEESQGFEYICSCPDFIFHAWVNREDCKHIEAVKVLALLANGPYNLAQQLLEL